MHAVHKIQIKGAAAAAAAAQQQQQQFTALAQLVSRKPRSFCQRQVHVLTLYNRPSPIQKGDVKARSQLPNGQGRRWGRTALGTPARGM